MAGTIKTNVQLGDSSTATQNFTLTAAAADGTMKLARGNAGATTQDILTVDANGRVAMPNNVVAFSAYQSSAQSISSGSWTKVQFQTKEYDTISGFDNTTNYRFQPTVSGYYQIDGRFIGSTSNITGVSIYKNGTAYKGGNWGPNLTASIASGLVYLNGSTDYVELYVFVGVSLSGGATTTDGTYFQGALIAKA